MSTFLHGPVYRGDAVAAEFLQDGIGAAVKTCPVTMQNLGRAALAYSAAFLVCYVLAISFATAANLVNLAAIGAELTAGDVMRTWLFDLWGMTPRWELARYGNVMLIAFAIAFPVAALIRAGVLRLGDRMHRVAALLYPLAGAVAIATGLTIMFNRYNVSAVAGARGLGFWAQCLAGGIAGFVFERVFARGGR
jgi:hypothetical protein